MALQHVEVFGEALPLPVDALGKRRAGDVLDALHQLDQELVVLGPHRREADAAVAHHRGGDAVPAGGRQQRIPGGLAVVVGVDVDEAGGDDHAGARRSRAAPSADLAHLDDAVAVDGDVADEGRFAGAVDDRPAANDQIPHALSRLLSVDDSARRAPTHRLFGTRSNRRAAGSLASGGDEPKLCR